MIAAPPKYYVYAVIDSTVSPAPLLAMRLTRQDARLVMQTLVDLAPPGALRVRRAKLTLFET